MKFNELFYSSKKKSRLSHFSNLACIAYADGVLDEMERKAIVALAFNAKMKPKELKRVFDRPGSIRFYVPKTVKERIEQIYDMVFIMMIKGKINRNEVTICKSFGIQLGFDLINIDEIINKVAKDMLDEVETEITISQLLKEYVKKSHFKNSVKLLI
jgi:hypothetical protein